MAIRTFIGTVDGDVNNAANYLEGYVPVNGDEMYYETAGQDMDTNLEALTGVILDELHIAAKAGKVGNADLNGDYFKIAAKVVNIGYEYGSGSPTAATRIKLHLEDTSDACVVNVFNTASSSADTGQEPVRLKIDDATAIVNVRKGRVAIADQEPGETSTLDKVLVSYVSNRGGDAKVVVGAGVTLATVEKTGGQMTLQSAATTVLNHAGDLTTEGAGAITTLTVEAGNVTANSSGTIGTLNANGGTVDLTRSLVARTVTTANRRGKGAIVYDPAIVTVTTLNTGGPVKVAAA